MRIYAFLLMALVTTAALSAAAVLYRTGTGTGAPPPQAVATSGTTAPPDAIKIELPPTAPAAAEPAAAKAPELPTIEVKAREVHVVPEDQPLPPAPPVSLRDRDGRLIARSAPPPSVAAALPAPAAPRWLSGKARVTGAVTLNVENRAVQLFGVRPAGSYDRCAAQPSGLRPCNEVARAALAARLADQSVNCHSPPGQRGEPAFICRDASGIDLGGFLVAEGYALADPERSRDYVGAEGVARSFQRGLWHYR